MFNSLAVTGLILIALLLAAFLVLTVMLSRSRKQIQNHACACWEYVGDNPHCPVHFAQDQNA